MPEPEPGHSHSSERQAADIVHLLANAERVFVLSGAGMSTESGIADFRGPNGLWTRNPAAARMFDIEAYRANRDVRMAAWEQRLHSPIRSASPNDGHRALADWQRTHSVTIATQNIDGLHQQAGSQDVLELHGSFWHSQCLDCGHRLPIAEAFARLEHGEQDPDCQQCGGILRTATVAFGQSLDPSVWRSAVAAAQAAEVAIAIGTSLSVQPAASLCTAAAATGAATIVINEQPTEFDAAADLVVRASIGPLLAAVSAGLAARA